MQITYYWAEDVQWLDAHVEADDGCTFLPTVSYKITFRIRFEADRGISQEMCRHCYLATAAVVKLNNLWHSNHTGLTTKLRLIQTGSFNTFYTCVVARAN